MYYFYLARCSDGSLYAGCCKYLLARESTHNAGQGALYTKKRLPIKIIYSEKYNTLAEARKREKQVKGWARIKKENLIKYGNPTGKRPLVHPTGDALRGQNL